MFCYKVVQYVTASPVEMYKRECTVAADQTVYRCSEWEGV